MAQQVSGQKQQELQMQYSNFKDTLQNIASQIGNVEQEVEEHKGHQYLSLENRISNSIPPKLHRSQSAKPISPGAPICRTEAKKKPITNQLSPARLVLETLTPLPTTRKCFRMINGVLVERTVGDVLPQLQSNSDNMNKVLVELAKQYKTKQDDMEKWKKKNKIQVVQQ
ncbi:hypothetical protein Q7P36_007206 [Cladosporium allicinum]